MIFIKNLFFLLIVCIALVSCISPAEKFSRLAEDLGLNAVTVQTKQFNHKVYANAAALNGPEDDSLHVYIDGDGTPWKNKRWIATDPTSRNPMILKLLNKDRHPAILLGRPCYHGLNLSPSCHFKYWTSHRYSHEVVGSMVQALNAFITKYHYKNVILIGFSGGGALSILMTPSLKEVSKVLTIAANLDVDAWSRHHGFSEMQESLNPVDIKLSSRIQQLHLLGGKDEVVPAITVSKYLDQNPTALFINYKQYTHQCCWVESWDDIMATLLSKI